MKIHWPWFLIFSLIFSSCENDHNEEWEAISKYGIHMILMEQTSHSIYDNNDGSLTYETRNGYNIVTGNTFIKKCFQGQVYRKAENDCKGTGSDADGWGAVKLNYCNTNDDSCNPLGHFGKYEGSYVYGDNSEIYTSCNSDQTLGYKWYPLYFLLTYMLNSGDYQKSNTEIPLDFNEIGLWMAGKFNTEKAMYIYYNATSNQGGGYSFSEINKNKKKYTLCTTGIPRED